MAGHLCTDYAWTTPGLRAADVRPTLNPHCHADASRPHGVRLVGVESDPCYCTVTDTGADGMPLATTTSELAPVSVPDATSKLVETVALPVATPIVL
jgi:hypothetical protein